MIAVLETQLSLLAVMWLSKAFFTKSVLHIAI